MCCQHPVQAYAVETSYNCQRIYKQGTAISSEDKAAVVAYRKRALYCFLNAICFADLAEVFKSGDHVVGIFGTITSMMDIYDLWPRHQPITDSDYNGANERARRARDYKRL
eukprot:m.768862 g.768862  ORF g.768862 m.768862 type:complete len:111 (-) comp23232_c2_seq8:301-633(-)